MNIGFDARCADDHFPGIGRYAYCLLEAMSRVSPTNSFTAFVSAKSNNSHFDFDTLRKRSRVNLVQVAASPFELKQQKLFPQLAAQMELDIYHSPYYLRPLYMPCPSITTIHDLIPLVSRGAEPNPLKRTIFSASIRLALRCSQAIIVDSQQTRSDILRRYGTEPDKITVVPLAANLFAKAPASARPDNIRKPFVLTVGTLKPHKGIHDLVKTWEGMPDSIHNHYQLVLAGPRATGKSAIPTQDHTNASIVETGAISQATLAWLYQHAEILVFPSYYEGFGLPILEAMSQGLPVVARNTLVAHEIAGDAACYFDSTNLHETLTRLLLDHKRRKTLSKAGYVRTQLFSWEETARQTLAVYHKVAHGAHENTSYL